MRAPSGSLNVFTFPEYLLPISYMKILLYSICLLSTLILLRINVNLHRGPHSPEETREDILQELNFLEDQLKNHELGNKMQRLFPEGYLFIHALYGLAWCELASNSEQSTFKKRAISEALYAYTCIESDYAKRTFPKDLEPAHGIFYTGWKNYLLGKLLLMDHSSELTRPFIHRYKMDSKAIALALQHAPGPFLESYKNQAWPADTFVAMASLSTYDQIFGHQYTALIQNWLLKVKKHQDEKTGMIPHKADPETGETIQGAHGSSTALILRMLSEIDPYFGIEQLALADSLFITTSLGLPAMREYPTGTFGLGDIDSGPVIMGVGFSATITMIGTLAAYDRPMEALHQYQTIHAFGLDRTNNEQKYYLYGLMPMADAFIAWGRAAALRQDTASSNWTWSLMFHLISFSGCLLLWLFVFRKKFLPYFDRKHPS